MPLSSAVVRKTSLPQMMGEDQPSPATAVFHFTFSVALHFSGSSAPVDMP